MSNYLELKESIRRLDEFNKFCKAYIKEYKKNHYVEECADIFTGYYSEKDLPERKDWHIKELI
jgi:hypothetical protein